MSNLQPGGPGPVIEQIIALGSAVALVAGTPKTIAQITLLAGVEYDVSASVWYTGGATTQVTLMASGISPTTNTLPTQGQTDSARDVYAPGSVPFATQDVAQQMGPTKIVGTGVPIFLIADLAFTISTASAYGHIRARPVR